MVIHNNNVEHHSHMRKRIYKNFEDIENTTKTKKTIDILIYVIAIIGPFMTIPQAYKIWVEQSALGMSLISWSYYLISSIIWLAYGILHKERPIIISNMLGLVIIAIIVLEIIKFS